MNSDDRGARLRKIRLDIEEHGLSVTVVAGEPLPRYSYTIGLRDVIGFDLIIAGASRYSAKDVGHIANAIGAVLRDDPTLTSIEVSPNGRFWLRPAHVSWVEMLALGAFDLYGTDNVSAVQVVPDADHLTIDVPDMAQEWSPSHEPVWQWLDRPWRHTVPSRSVATTNLAALQGAPVTELARWGEAEWEMFAGPGPDVTAGDVRVVPLGTMVGADPSLKVAFDTEIGSGFWRTTTDSEWQAWKRRAAP